MRGVDGSAKALRHRPSTIRRGAVSHVEVAAAALPAVQASVFAAGNKQIVPVGRYGLRRLLIGCVGRAAHVGRLQPQFLATGVGGGGKKVLVYSAHPTCKVERLRVGGDIGEHLGILGIDIAAQVAHRNDGGVLHGLGYILCLQAEGMPGACVLAIVVAGDEC